MDVPIDVFPRSAVVTLGAERAVVTLSVEIIVVEKDRDSGEVCVPSEMGKATDVTSC